MIHITTANEDVSTITCFLNSDLAAVHNWLMKNKIRPKLVNMIIGLRQNLIKAKFMNLKMDISCYRPIEHKP